MLAHMLRMDPLQVRVIAPDVGGGFGPKMAFYAEDVLVPVFRDGQPVSGRLGYLALLAVYAAALAGIASLTLRERE